MDVEAAIANKNFGTAKAVKRGRTADRPYVPVIDYGYRGFDKVHSKQIKGKAFATKEDAIACAERAIEHHRESLKQRLLDPRHRLLRAQYGLPETL